MRAIFLIALREFAENAKTKGFWIGLFLFPIIIFASIFVQKILDEATPTRNYVLVDQSGEYAGVVRQTMERRHQADVMRALGEYQSKYAIEQVEAERPDLESMPAIDQAAMAEKMTKGFGDQLDAMLTEEGIDEILEAMAPLLVEDRPEFEEPRRRFLEVPLPDGISPEASIDEIGRALKPYLKSEASISVDGESVELFAAILIPADVDETVTGSGDLAGLAAAMGDGARRGVQYWTSNLADEDLKDRVR
ncbi:MAG: hypothetical protein H8D72_00020, partial [Planctomycetes bacterium]|nr:hypothetical protein [Planctomycetota bacterium]